MSKHYSDLTTEQKKRALKLGAELFDKKKGYHLRVEAAKRRFNSGTWKVSLDASGNVKRVRDNSLASIFSV